MCRNWHFAGYWQNNVALIEKSLPTTVVDDPLCAWHTTTMKCYFFANYMEQEINQVNIGVATQGNKTLVNKHRKNTYKISKC